MSDQDENSNNSLMTDEESQAPSAEELESELDELLSMVEEKKKGVSSWRKEVKKLKQEYAEWGLDEDGYNDAQPEEERTPEDVIPQGFDDDEDGYF